MTIAVIIWYLYKENDRVLFSGHYETKRNDLISMGSEKYNQQNGTKKKKMKIKEIVGGYSILYYTRNTNTINSFIYNTPTGYCKFNRSYFSTERLV